MHNTITFARQCLIFQARLYKYEVHAERLGSPTFHKHKTRIYLSLVETCHVGDFGLIYPGFVMILLVLFLCSSNENWREQHLWSFFLLYNNFAWL